jgi:hypothetical protein
MSRWSPAARLGLGLAVCLLVASSGLVRAETVETDDDKDLVVERTVELQVQLLGVETLPLPGSTAIARFRIRDGEYRGSLFSLAYDYSRPVRVRSWDVHEPSGYRRIGGARVTEPPLGQWDELFRPGSHKPVDTIVMTLVQTDLNEDEEDRRWHFTSIESIRPWRVYDVLDPMRRGSREVPASLPDR